MNEKPRPSEGVKEKLFPIVRIKEDNRLVINVEIQMNAFRNILTNHNSKRCKSYIGPILYFFCSSP